MNRGFLEVWEKRCNTRNTRNTTPSHAAQEQSDCSKCPPSGRLGRIQRQVRRALIAKPDQTFTTTQLLEWCYPRATAFQRKHRRSVRRAAVRFADRVGWDGRLRLWAAKATELISVGRSEAIGKTREITACRDRVAPNKDRE